MFETSRINVTDADRKGRPFTSTNEQIVTLPQDPQAIILGDCRVTTGEIVTRVNINVHVLGAKPLA
jgi:hypothetical protein